MKKMFDFLGAGCVWQITGSRQYVGWKRSSLKTENKCKSGCNASGRKELTMMENQLVEVIVENGITYQLAENGCYYPQLSLEQKTDYVIGKYGIMRGKLLVKYRRHEYLKMLMDGTWNQYLHDVDEECQREVELAVKRIMEKEGVTEQGAEGKWDKGEGGGGSYKSINVDIFIKTELL